jgi:hypothetical protein
MTPMIPRPRQPAATFKTLPAKRPPKVCAAQANLSNSSRKALLVHLKTCLTSFPPGHAILSRDLLPLEIPAHNAGRKKQTP